MTKSTDIELQNFQEVKYIPSTVPTVSQSWKYWIIQEKRRNLFIAIVVGILVLAMVISISLSLSLQNRIPSHVETTRFLVFGGYQQQNYQDYWNYTVISQTEVFDLKSNGSNCCISPEFPFQTSCGATTVTSKGILLCGGHNHATDAKTSDCYQLQSDMSYSKAGSMTEPRSSFVSVLLENRDVWMIGGWDGDKFLSSTEIVGETGSKPSIELPLTLGYHCLIKINETFALLTGGITREPNISSTTINHTYFVNLITNELSNGPSLLSQRCWHSCESFVLNGKTFGIVSGGYTGSSYGSQFLDTSEILDFSDNSQSWKKGPKLPRKINRATMVKSNTGKVLLVGGRYEMEVARGEISQLLCEDQILENCQWIDLEYALKIPRISPYVVPLPNPNLLDIDCKTCIF